MGLPYDENFIILTVIVFYDTPVWRTDGRAIAYSALSVICCRVLKTHKNVSTILQNCAIARISLHCIHLLLNRASPKLQKKMQMRPFQLAKMKKNRRFWGWFFEKKILGHSPQTPILRGATSSPVSKSERQHNIVERQQAADDNMTSFIRRHCDVWQISRPVTSVDRQYHVTSGLSAYAQHSHIDLSTSLLCGPHYGPH